MAERTCSVVGIGELLWDLLPDGPRLGGAPFNAVAHLARLGCRASFVSAVGRDELGRRALAEVASLRVNADLIGVSHLPTGVVRIELDEHGVPVYEIVSPAAYEVVELPNRPDPATTGDADMIVMGTLAQRFPAVREATRRIMDDNPGAEVLYDVNLRPGCWDAGLVEQLLGDATLVKLNEEEQATLANALELPASGAEPFARMACDRYGLRGACVTRGPSGAALLLDDVYLDAPAPRVPVVDTVGAGDAFAAGLGYGVLKSWSVAEILDLANRLGSFVVSRAGAIPTEETGRSA